MQTRILVVIAHFFKPEQDGKYSSTRGENENDRRRALVETISGWLSLSKASRHLDVHNKRFLRVPGDVKVDIIVLKNGCNNLIPEFLAEHPSVKTTQVNVENTRYLPFASHLVMKNNLNNYDWYVYSEDDLHVTDPAFFDKVILFNSEFGDEFVLMPNRFELNLSKPEIKTYVDGFNQSPRFIEDMQRMKTINLAFLSLSVNGKTMKFERANNPHSGCFVINSAQLKEWIAKSYFGSLDATLVSPMESAATLGIIKTFFVMKPSPENADWLEIRHLDSKFSSLSLPII